MQSVGKSSVSWDSSDDLNRIPARVKKKLAVLQWGVIGKLMGMLARCTLTFLKKIF